MTDTPPNERTARQRLADAVLHRGPGYDLTPEPAPSDQAATEATDRADLRKCIAKAIHLYDYDHMLSGNDIPSKHHYGEADAVLAVRDREMEALRAEVAAARKFAGEMRDFCSPHGVSVHYADQLEAAMDRAKEGTA